MKALKLIVVSILVGLGTARADQTTSRLGGLTVPTIGSFNWGPKINTDLFQISSNTCSQIDVNTFSSSATFVSPLGTAFTYNVSVGSMTGAGLTNCTGVSNALTWSSASSQFGCNTISGGGGGSSVLAVSSGSASGAVIVSSPTAVVLVDSNTFKASLVGGATAFLQLNPSSVTLQGQNVITSVGISTGISNTGTATAPVIALVNPVSIANGGTSTSTFVNKEPIYYNGTILASDANTSIWASSRTFTGTGGVGVTYGVVAGSVTAGNLTSGQCVQAGTGGALTTTGQACNITSGASTLAVTTGSASSFSSIASSPTAVLNLEQTEFNAALKGTATGYVSLNTSSVTLQANTFNGNTQLVQTNNIGQYPALNGNLITNLNSSNISGIVPSANLPPFIALQSTLQSGATFYTSSGTVNGNLYAGTFVSSSIAQSDVLYAGSGGSLTGDGNMTWDSTNHHFVVTGSFPFDGGDISSNNPDWITLKNHQGVGDNRYFHFGLDNSVGPRYLWQANTTSEFTANGTTLMTLDATGKLGLPSLNASSPLCTDVSSNVTTSGCGSSGSSLLSSTNTWTGMNTFQSSTTFNQTIVVSSNIIANEGVLNLSGGTLITTSTIAGGNLQTLNAGSLILENSDNSAAVELTPFGSNGFDSLSIITSGASNGEVKISSISFTISPSSFSVVTSTVSTYEAAFSTSAAGPYHIDVSTTGHLNSQTVTGSTVTSCGANASLTGSDIAGIISTGSGSPTSCVLTFSQPFKNTPVCVCSPNSGVSCGVSSASASSVTFALSVTETKIYYHCIGSD